MRILKYVGALVLHIARIYQYDTVMEVTSGKVAADEAERQSLMVSKSQSTHGWSVLSKSLVLQLQQSAGRPECG